MISGLRRLKTSDIFVSMKTVTKRELVRNPALASQLLGGALGMRERSGVAGEPVDRIPYCEHLVDVYVALKTAGLADRLGERV